MTGKSRESVKLQDGQTVGDLTARLSREYGGKLEELLKPATGPRRVLVVRDGVGLHDSSILTDGDLVLILFPVAGG